MAKSRMIKPETWTDEKFVALPPLARLLFIGMWNFACDNGHLDDSVLQLKMRVLPGDSCDVKDLLDALVSAGMVERRDGWLKVVNLSEKQPLDMRYLVFCDHCLHDERTTYSPDDKKQTRRFPRVHTASTPRVHDEHPKSARRSGDGDGDGDGVTTSLDNEFADWYKAYPRKAGRGQAIKAYRAARKKPGVTAQSLIDALSRQVPQMTAKGVEFCPHPATWLNGERWADEADNVHLFPQPRLGPGDPGWRGYGQ